MNGINTELESALLDAFESIRARGIGAPMDAYHPDFGWVIRNGKPTEFTEKFLLYIKETKKEKNGNTNHNTRK